MRYMMNDGHVIEAKDVSELVDRMREASWDNTDSVQAYMTVTAHRVQEQTGHKVSTKNATAFVRDLIAAGMIKEAPAITVAQDKDLGGEDE